MILGLIFYSSFILISFFLIAVILLSMYLVILELVRKIKVKHNYYFNDNNDIKYLYVKKVVLNEKQKDK